MNFRAMINHRKISSLLLLFTAMFLVVSFYGCRTSKKLIEKNKTEKESLEIKTNKIDSSSVVVKNNEVKTIDSLSFSSSLKLFDVSFLGTSKDDYGEIIKTETGLIFKGNIVANLKGSQVQKDLSTSSLKTEKVDEDTNIQSSSKSETQIKEKLSITEKSKTINSIGFSFFAIVILSLIIFYAYWRYIRK